MFEFKVQLQTFSVTVDARYGIGRILGNAYEMQEPNPWPVPQSSHSALKGAE